MQAQILIANSESGFKALFTHATVGIIIVNHVGLVEHANPFVCNMLGYEEEELSGQDISFLIPQSLRHQHQQHILSYFRNPINRPMGQGIELKAVKKNGDELYVEISLCSYSIENEKFAVAFISDISRQKEEAEKLKNYQKNLEQTVKDRTEELKNALDREKQNGQIKSRFVSLASHEFRTPLSTILSSTSLIKRYNDTIGSENIGKHTARIKSAVNNLTQILNDFLSLDKLEQGAISAHPEYFHLSDFIADICDEMENYLKPGQSITRQHSGENMIYTDKKLTKNILFNLISNASKYSDESKTIAIHTTVEDQWLKIKIIDQGIGIPPKELEKLFSLFYRCSNVGSIQGTGLGLNIVSKYISLMGGELKVSSIENEGSTFKVLLPIGDKIDKHPATT